MLSPGACFLDYDSDGQVDIFVADNGPEGGHRPLSQLGRVASLKMSTGRPGSIPLFTRHGCTAGDYDNDGLTDLAVQFDGSSPAAAQREERHIQGRDRSAGQDIREQAAHSTLGLNFIRLRPRRRSRSIRRGSTGPRIVDSKVRSSAIKRFGETSARTAGRCYCTTTGSGNRMWRNNGNGTFTDVTERPGFAAASSTGGDWNRLQQRSRGRSLWSPAGKESADDFRKSERREVHRSSSMPDLRRHRERVAVAVLDFDHDGWMDMAFTQGGATRPYALAQQSRQDLRSGPTSRDELGPRLTASPPSTTTTTAGSIWSPSAKLKTARAKCGCFAISGLTVSKMSLPTLGSTRFNSKSRARSSPATTMATARPIC